MGADGPGKDSEEALLSAYFVARALRLRAELRIAIPSPAPRSREPASPKNPPCLWSPLMLLDLVKALFLGVVEGLTEFLPVSSTGHLLLVQRFFGFDDADFGKTFAVLIQFGAILALLSIYWAMSRSLRSPRSSNTRTCLSRAPPGIELCNFPATERKRR